MDTSLLEMDRLGAVKDRVRKRVLTDARKEQNRVAQRAYRQRQKEASRDSNIRLSANKGHKRLEPHARVNSDLPHQIQLLNEPRNDSSEPATVVNELGLAGGSGNSQQTGFDSVHLDLPSTSDCAVSQPELAVGPIEAGDSNVPYFERQATFGSPPALAHPDFLEILSTPNDSNSPDSNSWPLLQDLRTGSGQREGVWPCNSPSTQASYPCQSNTLLIAGHEKPHEYSSLTSNPSSSSEARPRGEDAEEDITIFPNHADPVANLLQLSQTPVFYATLHNAHVLGITISQLLTARHLSPFYRPTTPADDPRALVAAAYNPSFPAHLQPTLAQIMFPHHAYLDLLPFPTFRTRAIAMSMVRPRLFDHTELKRDIVVNGGLSWDMQTWQIAPWFFNKWKMLLVRHDSDVWM